MLPPGSTIGMLGGGQLGRMAALAAATLGYHMHVYAQNADEPAVEVARRATIAAWDDEAALQDFAAAVDVITLEFENVPVATVEFLAKLKPVFPGAEALRVAQDRVTEKSFLNKFGIETAPWAAVSSASDLTEAVARLGLPAFLKTTRFGYDGRGQLRLTNADAEPIWQQMGAVPLILEGAVNFACEVSLVLVRGQNGLIDFYPLVQNRHVDGILAETIAPAVVNETINAAAQEIGRRIAEELNYVGVLAVEFFLTRDNRLLVNEIAPRPHNSGHWTIDACACSQFEQQIRAVCGLPLGPTAPHSSAIMRNMIGDQVTDWQDILADPAARLHLYGKSETRPGRKMGHVTRVYHDR